MALAFATRTLRQKWANRAGKNERITLVTLDAAYTVGGYAITAKQLGFDSTIDYVLATPAGGYVFEWDYTNLKLIARRTGAALAGVLAEAAANEATLNGVVVRIYAIGY